MATKKKRIQIPDNIESSVMFDSNMKCCVCTNRKGDHIHHLDSHTSNFEYNNLALLCVRHHELAGITNNITKKLSKATIIKYRSHHYQVITNARKKALRKSNSKTKGKGGGSGGDSAKTSDDEQLLVIAKNAIIIIELDKIKQEFYRKEWRERSEVISRLNIHVDHNNPRLAKDVIYFLEDVASTTRSGMTFGASLMVFSTMLNFFPSLYQDNNRTETIEIAKRCVYLGNNIVYDSFIHLRNFAVAACGLTILKFIYREAKDYGIKELTDEVNRAYSELEEQIKRPDRTDLVNAEVLLKTFKDDLESWDLSFPMLPEHIMKIFNADKKSEE